MNTPKGNYNDQEYEVSIILCVGKCEQFEDAAVRFKEMLASEEYTWEYEVENITTGEKKTVVV